MNDSLKEKRAQLFCDIYRTVHSTLISKWPLPKSINPSAEAYGQAQIAVKHFDEEFENEKP